MKQAFVPKSFRAGSLETINTANAIIAEYAALGFSLTLRQLYYQFVARDLIANKHTEYKRLGSIINDARLAGLVDWDAIEDRTRNVNHPSVWDDPESILRAVANQYQEDPWLTQKDRVEVWIEKDALIGVIEPVCKRWRVPYFACRGNVSQSEQYAAGQRFRREHRNTGRPTIVLHLGDHDPSGTDMTRDNQDRLLMFAGYGRVQVRRLALNMDQIEQYDPPPNPAKETDSKFEAYRKTYGTDQSWELDALEPTVIDQLIEDEIGSIVDREAWDFAMDAESENKDVLVGLSSRWEDVKAFMQAPGEEE